MAQYKRGGCSTKQRSGAPLFNAAQSLLRLCGSKRQAHRATDKDSQQPESQQRSRLHVRRARSSGTSDGRTFDFAALDTNLLVRSLRQPHVGDVEWLLGEERARCWERGPVLPLPLGEG